jgi:glycosyltransferase involved in cell wall biosynthesis
MRIMFVHQNFPGQYRHLAPYFAADPRNQVVSIGEHKEDRVAALKEWKGLRHLTYPKPRGASATTHHYLHGFEASVRRGQAVARLAMELRNKDGFVPQVICAHCGWGESLFLKEIYPEARLLNYFEFFYRVRGSDIGFDPEFPPKADEMFSVPMRNATQLQSLAVSDWGISPTEWQRNQFPPFWRALLSVIHEGVDTRMVRPDPNAVLKLEQHKLELTRNDEVVTYLARNLEPYRGFHVFMRALPALLKRRPNARVLIVGGDETSYGRKPQGAENWREKMMKEVGAELDTARVHFLGKIPYPDFLRMLQISSAHVYLTVPFVLSWSMLEAMSAGCLIVGSRTPPVLEVMQDGINGLLVDFLSPSAVTERVIEALENQKDLAPLRKNARQTVIERFDLRKVCMPQQLALINMLASR